VNSIDLLNKYGFSLKDSKIGLILDKDIVNEMENYIFLKRNINMLYDVCEKHRNNVVIKVQNLSKETAILMSVVLYKKMFDNNLHYHVIRELRTLLEKNSIDKALTYFEQFPNDIYVIGNIEINKLSLVKYTEGYSMFFNGNKIFEKVSLSRAYVALYNYCKKIVDIKNFYMENKSYFIQNKIEIINVIEMYIL